MNHGSLGSINELGEVSLKNEILRSLCLVNNSKLYGIYYPCPPEAVNVDYKGITLKNDLMLTPIPSRFWHASARIHLHISNKAESLSVVSDYLQKHKISIIHSESSRSAFRYSTWSAHIVFEDLIQDGVKLTFIDGKNYYEETYRELLDLLDELNNKNVLSEYLYCPDYFPRAEGNINSSLAYFTNFYKERDKIDWLDEKWIIEPFELTVRADDKQEILVGDSKFNDVISYLKKSDSNSLPAILFSELDFRSLNIRSILIPRKASNRFFMAGIEYERIGGTDSCVGIIHSIISEFPPHYHIWQSYNYTINSSENRDKGNLVFLIEDITNVGNKRTEYIRTRETYTEEANKVIIDIINSSALANIRFAHPAVYSLPDPESLKINFEKNFQQRKYREYKKDVFISYSHSNEEFVNKLVPRLEYLGVSVFRDVDVFNYGDIIEPAVLDNILNSREMCVVMSAKSKESEWVTTEWGAALVLGKRLVSIRLSKDIELPKRLDSRYNIYIEDGNFDESIEKYASEIKKRKFENDGERYFHFFSGE